MNRKVAQSVVVALATSALTIPLTSVEAQDALGAGDALDANLSVGGRANAPRPQENYRERNLIVTGDVAGGRGFRGSVGYTASSDFRGNTGSNDLFPFLADSAYSSPALFQLGSTYEQLRFGQAVGALEYRRAQSGSPAALHPQNPIPVDQIRSAAGITTSPFEQHRLDRTNLISSSASGFQSAVEPQIVGMTYNQENRPFVFNASSLRGITLEPMNQSVGTVGLSTLDAARLRQDIERGAVPPVIGTPFQTDFEDTPLPGAALRHGNDPTPNRVDANILKQPDYANVLTQIAERYAAEKGAESGNPETLKQLQDDYRALRSELRAGQGRVSNRVGGRFGDLPESGSVDETQLSAAAILSATPPGIDLATPSEMDQGPTIETPTEQRQPGQLVPRESITQRESLERPGVRPGEEKPATDEARTRRTPTEMASVLRHGQRVERLSGENQDRFNELLKSAEEKLRDGDYFVAEHRFERALRFVPGHPMATAGIGHAQLGGGLYLSSALTLQTLLINYPEMIDITFSPDLLPPRERLDKAVQTLRQQIQEARERGNYAFLLAYIGHQLGDRDVMVQGLDAMVEANPDDKLAPVLREVWLTPPALRDAKPAAQPAPVPQK